MIAGDADLEVATGTNDGDDDINGGNGDDSLEGFGGDDIVRGSRGDDLISGSSCLLYTSPSPRDQRGSRMPSSA